MRVERAPHRGHLWILLLFAIVISFMLIGVLAGVNIYSEVQKSSDNNEQFRAVNSFILASVRSADSKNSLAVREGPDGDMLCIQDTSGMAETHLYLYKNKLYTEYTSDITGYDPKNATAIAALSSFAIQESANILEIKTNLGTIHVAQRKNSTKAKSR